MGICSSQKVSYRPQYARGHHECEVLEGGVETLESANLWNCCKKNPGHEKFISIQDINDSRILNSMDDKQRQMLKLAVDRTVRVRVQRTSLQRPDDDRLSDCRGSDWLRLGTGYIVGDVKGPRHSKPCPCTKCVGKISFDYWTFCVRTAHHVVYNTEEAKNTKVDLFYDDERCLGVDGGMQTVCVVDMDWSSPDTDACSMLCVTHDEVLAKRINSINVRRHPLVDSYVRSSSSPKKNRVLDRFRKSLIPLRHDYALIVSHPHGQAKKITVGKLRVSRKRLLGNVHVQYDTVTCPGSSGATVFPFNLDSWVEHSDPYLYQFYPWRVSVHSGTYDKATSKFKSQVNYGSNWSYV